MGIVQDGLVLWLDARAQRQLIKMGQSDNVWKDLSGNGNDCEVHREVFEYPPILEGGRNLLRNSDFKFGLDVYWDIVNASPLSNFTITSEGLLKVTKSSYDADFGKLNFISLNNLRDVENLTASAWVKGNGEFTIRFGGSSTHVETVNSDTIKKYVFHIPKSRFGNGNFIISVTSGVIFFDRVKAEIGNTATPWTPAPEDLGLEYPDWVQNFHPSLKYRWYENKLYFINSDSHIRIPEINLNPENFTIQVDNRIRAFDGDKVITENGDEWGRNLLRNSRLNYIPGRTYGTGDISEIVEDELHGSVYHTNKQYIFGNELYVAGGELNVGDVVTISILIKSKDGTPIYAQLYNTATLTSGQFSIPTSTEWEWRSVTRTITGDPSVDSRFYLYASNGEYWIKQIKIEKGSVATPWTPAPEDITEVNIINRNTPFVENNAIRTLRFYNRALTDEEILQNYRATHFLLEPKTFTSNDYYNYYDLNRVEINTLATKDLTEVLRGDINLEDIDFERDMKSIPFADVLNKIEKNINTLGNKLYKPKGWTQPKLDWTYNQPFSYVDANRLERNILLLYNYAKGNIDNIPHCGMYICGEEVV